VLVIRLVGILAIVAVAVGIVLFVLTGDRRCLKFVRQLLKWTVIFALLFFALLVLERLSTLI